MACLFSACAETITQYRADSSGRLRKVSTTVIPHTDEISYSVNGASLSFRLRAIGGGGVMHRLDVTLAPGQNQLVFSELRDARFLELGDTAFGGNIHRVRRQVTVDQLPAEARPGGEAEHMFAPKALPSSVEFRDVRGRRWLVTSKFMDPAKRFVRSQVWWTVAGEFIVTLYVHLEQAPADASWRQHRLDQLASLASGFTYIPRTKPNQAIQPTAGRSDASFPMTSTPPFQISLAIASGG